MIFKQSPFPKLAILATHDMQAQALRVDIIKRRTATLYDNIYEYPGGCPIHRWEMPCRASCTTTLTWANQSVNPLISVSATLVSDFSSEQLQYEVVKVQ